MAGMVTWYDVLGVPPGASPGQVQSAYQARARLLDLQVLSGASSKVLKAADAARAAADEAWRVLRDAAARQRYDEEIGVRVTGGGLDRPVPVPSGPAESPPPGASRQT
jgi:curved DNA-binding protein CbpA